MPGRSKTWTPECLSALLAAGASRGRLLDVWTSRHPETSPRLKRRCPEHPVFGAWTSAHTVARTTDVCVSEVAALRATVGSTPRRAPGYPDICMSRCSSVQTLRRPGVQSGDAGTPEGRNVSDVTGPRTRGRLDVWTSRRLERRRLPRRPATPDAPTSRHLNARTSRRPPLPMYRTGLSHPASKPGAPVWSDATTSSASRAMRHTPHA
jgi:hypothetical protein